VKEVSLLFAEVIMSRKKGNPMAIEILTAVLLAITGCYVVITYKILRSNQAAVQQMKNQQEAMLRPYIVISPLLYPNDVVFHLRIRNTGMTPARNLRLSIDRKFYQFGDTSSGNNDLGCFSAFNVPIESFPPGAEMVFDLAQSDKILGPQADQNVTPSTFEISASYQFSDEDVHETTQIDLRPYRDALLPRDETGATVMSPRHVLDKKRPCC
jgi:hypothetical protein